MYMFLYLLTFGILHLSSATTTTDSALYATLDPNIRDIITDTYLPSDYVLPENVYEWNVTEIVSFINAADPELLYSIDTPLLFSLFPEYFIQNLPRDILIAHKLYYYLPFDDPLYCFNITNCTAPTIAAIDPCFGPFVHTIHDGFFIFPNGSKTYQCALRCELTQTLWNISDDDMDLVDAFFFVFTTVFLAMLLIIWLNLGMDIGLNKHNCCNRGFLFQAPICIVMIYTLLAFLFLIPLLIGKEEVACSQDLDGVKTFGSYNPGSSALCTVVGILFYGALMTVGGYTAYFSFDLWKTFYAPLNSIVDELRQKSVCKCCCAVMTVFANCGDKCGSGTGSKCIRCQQFLNTSLFKHCLIYSISFTYILIGCLNNEIDAVPPLGICSMGSRSKKATIFYNTIPTAIFLFLATLFVPAAILLLVRVAKKGNAQSKREFKEFKWRLLVYFLCVEVSWFILVFVTSCIFYVNRDRFEHDAQKRTECMLMKAGTSTASEETFEECMFGYTYWIGWYIIVGLILPFAGFGSLMLSCNDKNWRRWLVIFDVVFTRLCLCRRAQSTDERMVMRLANVEVTVNSRSPRTMTGTKTTTSKSGDRTSTAPKGTSDMELCRSKSISSDTANEITLEANKSIDSMDKQKPEELSD